MQASSVPCEDRQVAAASSKEARTEAALVTRSRLDVRLRRARPHDPIKWLMQGRTSAESQTGGRKLDWLHDYYRLHIGLSDSLIGEELQSGICLREIFHMLTTGTKLCLEAEERQARSRLCQLRIQLPASELI
jgi:hypothetical protein